MFCKPVILVAVVATPAMAQTSPAPAPISAAPSAADLAMGRDIAARILPDGTYQRMMGGMMAKMMDGMSSQMTAMPLAPFLKAAGLPANQTAKLGQTTIRQIMAIVDPAYQQRMDVMMPVMMTEMGRVMTQFEPEMRDGLAHAYASHFTAAQLRDIDGFFQTPSGAAFAHDSMTIAADPAVMQKMQAFMPVLAKAMPAIMEKANAATAALPKPRTIDTLSDADRAKLAQLLGMPAAAFHGPTAMPHADVSRMKLSPDNPAKPVEDVTRVFGNADYPPAAMRAGEEGRVIAKLAIDPAGRVTDCAIDVSSGSASLDATTCRIATTRMAFVPATDHRGKPIAGSYRLAMRWVMPRAAPVVTPPPATGG